MRPSTAPPKRSSPETMEARKPTWEQHTERARHLALAAHSEYMRRHPDAELPPMRSAEPPQPAEEEHAQLVAATREVSTRHRVAHRAGRAEPRRPREDQGGRGPPRTERGPRVGGRRRSMAGRAAARTGRHPAAAHRRSGQPSRSLSGPPRWPARPTATGKLEGDSGPPHTDRKGTAGRLRQCCLTRVRLVPVTRTPLTWTGSSCSSTALSVVVGTLRR